MKQTIKTLTPDRLEHAVRHLAKSDKVLKRLIQKHGSCALLSGRRRPFDTLVRSIIGQMLSVAVAASIERRFSVVATRPYTPANIVRVGKRPLSSIGLSRRKVDCILDLSKAVLANEIDLKALGKLPDEDVIAKLTTINGIGRWTADMFLIFGLYRPDVWAAADAGLLRALRDLYGDRIVGEGDFPPRVTERWRPYRSVASWYLWRHLD